MSNLIKMINVNIPVTGTKMNENSLHFFNAK